MGTDELQNVAGTFRLIGIGVTFVGFVLTCVSHVVAERLLISQRADKQRSAERQAATGRELEITKAQTADLAAKAAPRSLLPSQRETLTKGFADRVGAGKARIPIIVCSKMLDPESADFAAQIFGPLEQSGWESRHNPMGATPFPGIKIIANGDEATSTLDDIKELFTQADISFTVGGIKANACPLQFSPAVYVFVGQK